MNAVIEKLSAMTIRMLSLRRRARAKLKKVRPLMCRVRAKGGCFAFLNKLNAFSDNHFAGKGLV